MHPLEFPLLADENIHPDVVAGLRTQGKDVRTASDEALVGASDFEVLERAQAQGRVVLTHDSDFGILAIRASKPYLGIIYVRPGHISAAFVLETIAAISSIASPIDPPFLVVAERRGDEVRIRVRSSVVAG